MSTATALKPKAKPRARFKFPLGGEVRISGTDTKAEVIGRTQRTGGVEEYEIETKDSRMSAVPVHMLTAVK